jgi:hypothetical protein
MWEKFLSNFTTYDRTYKPDILWGNPKAVPVLIDLTKEKTNRILLHEVYSTLKTIGPTASDAVPRLKEDLESEDAEVSLRALNVLARVDPDAVQFLIETLKDDRPEIRQAAAGELAQIGPTAKAAVPSLVGALKDKEKGVREWAGIALLHIDPVAASRASADKVFPQGPNVAASR